jgi:hypothetical protein
MKSASQEADSYFAVQCKEIEENCLLQFYVNKYQGIATKVGVSERERERISKPTNDLLCREQYTS